MFNKDKTIRFEIVTPERVVLKEDIYQVTAPTRDGEITVLPDHTPLVSILNPGVVEIKKHDGSINVISLSGGFIEVLRNKVVILADTAERAEEIDLERAEEARSRAEAAIKDLRQFDAERYANIAGQIAKELARTKAVSRWRNLNHK